MKLEDLLKELVEKNGSDLHLKFGRPPIYRIAGELFPTEYATLDDVTIKNLLYSIMTREKIKELEETFECDMSYMIPDLARFRINVFFQRGHIGAAFRTIPIKIPTIDELELPQVLKELALQKQGMVIITGPTGSGKSTTMASMIDYLNSNLRKHIVTVEDPIEFVFDDKLCAIDQRQVGSDTKNFEEALKRALRQDPDVILMGEMRDRQSMEFAMHASETGHIVFTTLHTNDAKQTLDRILDTFPGDMAVQIRSMLALTLLAVLSQRLVKRADGSGRIAACEVMINTPHIQQLLLKGAVQDIDKAIKTGRKYYKTQTFNQHLCDLVVEGSITREEAILNSFSPGDLKLMLKGVGIGVEGIQIEEQEGEKEEEEFLVEEEGTVEDANVKTKKLNVDRGFEF